MIAGLSTILTCAGEKQQELFKRAREIRNKYFGNEITFRGVIEISNICQKNCDFCAMRRANRSLNRFRLGSEEIIEGARNITDVGIDTVFLQAGQDPRCDPILENVIPTITNELGANIILNVGERDKETYELYSRLGAKGFIMKYETSDNKLYESIAHDPLSNRIQCMNWIRSSGLKIGTGNIIGLPGQSIESLVSDINLALDFKPDYASSAPFIPNKGTPLENLGLGNLDLTLNTMALLRIGLKDALIPSVSALEYIYSGGQLMGLDAGANVMTINFTPQSYRKNYNIYNNDRFIVSLGHAINTAKKAGLKIDPKISSRVKIGVIFVFALTLHLLRVIGGFIDNLIR